MLLFWTVACAVSFFQQSPPVGARYAGSLSVPIVGTQHMLLEVEPKSMATIRLDGIVNHKERVSFSMDDDHVDFNLSDDLRRVLRRYTCVIADARYDHTADLARITFKVRLIGLRRVIELRRVGHAEVCSQ